MPVSLSHVCHSEQMPQDVKESEEDDCSSALLTTSDPVELQKLFDGPSMPTNSEVKQGPHVPATVEQGYLFNALQLGAMLQLAAFRDSPINAILSLIKSGSAASPFKLVRIAVKFESAGKGVT